MGTHVEATKTHPKFMLWITDAVRRADGYSLDGECLLQSYGDEKQQPDFVGKLYVTVPGNGRTRTPQITVRETIWDRVGIRWETEAFTDVQPPFLLCDDESQFILFDGPVQVTRASAAFAKRIENPYPMLHAFHFGKLRGLLIRTAGPKGRFHARLFGPHGTQIPLEYELHYIDFPDDDIGTVSLL